MKRYRIASFNLYKFSTNTEKELNEVSQIIRENKVDILAIQEIFSKGALDNLLKELNAKGNVHWDGRWASPNSRSVSAAEGYAFIWNKDRIELSQNRSGKVFEPRIHNQYPHRDGIELIRNPYYGRFVIKENRMTEFRLINTHIMFSFNREENELDDQESIVENLGAIAMRNRELDILAGKILPKLDDKAYDYQWNERDGICRKPYTILLGDYNLNLKDSPAKGSLIVNDEIMICDSIAEKKIITIQKDLSTLRKNTDSQEGGYRNNFDHFTYDQNRPLEVVRCWAVDAPNKMRNFAGDYEKYRKDVSDHLMVIMELKLI